jgi:hypothetical protein
VVAGALHRQRQRFGPAQIFRVRLRERDAGEVVDVRTHRIEGGALALLEHLSASLSSEHLNRSP